MYTQYSARSDSLKFLESNWKHQSELAGAVNYALDLITCINLCVLKA